MQVLPKLLLFLAVLAPFSSSFAQKDSIVPPPTFALAINQDNAFGFYPSVFGSFGINEQVSFTYYGLFWTNPAYGNLISGTDGWLEAGVGLSFPVADDRLILNPAIGTTHGTLLSNANEAKLLEGLVPSMIVLFLDGRLEVEVFFAYYKALKNEGPDAGDYLLYWILPGVVLSPNISIGMHFESYVLSRVSSGETGSLYQVFGGYLKFLVADKYAFRFSAGVNTVDEPPYSRQFYKLNLFIPLL